MWQNIRCQLQRDRVTKKLKMCWGNQNFYIFGPPKVGALAQLVEQWTENPCVPGSIPGGTT